jgi:hypothetical protein
VTARGPGPSSAAIPGTAFREPKDALVPSAFCVEAAERWALERAAALPADPFRLTALWYINFVRQPVPGERKTRYTMKIAQSETYGISAGLTPVLPDPDPELVGQDTRAILEHRQCRDHIERTALVDAVMGHVCRPSDQRITLDDTPQAKYAARAQIFADETAALLQRARPRAATPHVLVIGATAGIIEALVGRGFQVSATDLWPEAVGRDLGGVTVSSGDTANAGS